MTKLEEYIGRMNRIISSIAEARDKGYALFFDKMDSNFSRMAFKDNDINREFIFEYLVVNTAYFFEQNGVEYKANLDNYTRRLRYWKNIETIREDVLTSTKIQVVELAKQLKIPLADNGLLDYPALLYAFHCKPDMRERITEVFGSELISEDVFPDFARLQQNLEAVKIISTAILEKRKIDSLSHEDLIERALHEKVGESNKAIKEITAKIKTIEESIKQNSIYTLDNHPTYKKLQEELRICTAARDEAIKSIHSSSPSDLRKMIIVSSGIRDYEKLQQDERRARKVEGELAKDKLTPEKALEEANVHVEHAKNRLDSQNFRKAKIDTLTRQLELLDTLMGAEEFDTYHRVCVEKTNAEIDKWEKLEKVKKQKEQKEKLENSKKEYESMGFFERRSVRGKELKAIIDSETSTSSDIDTLCQLKAEEAIEKAEDVDKRYEDAMESYCLLYDSLNQDRALGLILQTPNRTNFLALSYDQIKACRARVANLLKTEKFAFEQICTVFGENEIQDTIDTYSERAAEIKAMLEHRRYNENLDEHFYRALDTAVDLVNESTADVNEEQDVVSSRK